jgi:hypothetical protein
MAQASLLAINGFRWKSISKLLVRSGECGEAEWVLAGIGYFQRRTTTRNRWTDAHFSSL